MREVTVLSHTCILISSMESQQIVDYIRQNLQAGHPETNIRNHMLANGWPQASVDAAFRRYHSVHTPAPKPASKAPEAKAKNLIKRKLQQRPSLRRRADSRRRAMIGFGVAAVVLIGFAVATKGVMVERAEKKPPATPVVKQTTAQRQMSDIINIAGAIDQYAFTYNVQPNIAVATADGGLRLCANICDPTTSEVSPLTVYSPSDVHFAGYTPGLSVPDVSAMYIVPSAACKGKPPTATQSNNTRSMIILYAVQMEDSTLQQRCAQL